MRPDNSSHHEPQRISIVRRRGGARSWLRVVEIVCALLGTIVLGWYAAARAQSYFVGGAPNRFVVRASIVAQTE